MLSCVPFAAGVQDSPGPDMTDSPFLHIKLGMANVDTMTDVGASAVAGSVRDADAAQDLIREPEVGVDARQDLGVHEVVGEVVEAGEVSAQEDGRHPQPATHQEL